MNNFYDTNVKFNGEKSGYLSFLFDIEKYCKNGNFILTVAGSAGSGKTTIRRQLEERMLNSNIYVHSLDLSEFRVSRSEPLPKIQYIIDEHIQEKVFDPDELEDKRILMLDSMDEFFEGRQEREVLLWLRKIIDLSFPFKKILIFVRDKTVPHRVVVQEIVYPRYLSDKLTIMNCEILDISEGEYNDLVNFLTKDRGVVDTDLSTKFELYTVGDFELLLNVEQEVSKYEREKELTNPKFTTDHVVRRYVIEKLRNVSPVYEDIDALQQLKRLGGIAHKSLDNQNIVGDDEELARWVTYLKSAGLLKKKRTIIFSNDRFRDVALANRLLTDLENQELPFDGVKSAYLPPSAYYCAAQLLSSYDVKELIFNVLKMGNFAEFFLACVMGYCSVTPIDLIIRWIEDSNYLRVKQRLAHSLYVRGYEKEYLDFLRAVSNSSRFDDEDDSVAIEHPLVIASRVSKPFDEKTAKQMLKYVDTNSVLTKYIASHLAGNINGPITATAASKFITIMKKGSFSTRTERYIIAAIGYLGDNVHADILRGFVDDATGVFKKDIRDSIRTIESRMSKQASSSPIWV